MVRNLKEKKKMSKKDKKYLIRPTDIVFQTIFPKRLCVATGEHSEFIVDADVARRMLDLIQKARIIQDDCDDSEIRVEYSDDSDNEYDNWCMVRFNDFSLNRLTTKELFRVEKGLLKFFEWSKNFSMSDIKPFMFKVK